MRSLPLFGLSIFFLLAAAGLYALTLRKPKPASAAPKKSELREQTALQAETKKMRIAAGVSAGIGVLLLVLSA